MKVVTRRLTQAEKDQHPSIHGSGSVSGMIKRGFWRKGDLIVRCDGFLYNMSIFIRNYQGRFLE